MLVFILLFLALVLPRILHESLWIFPGDVLVLILRVAILVLVSDGSVLLTSLTLPHDPFFQVSLDYYKISTWMLLVKLHRVLC